MTDVPSSEAPPAVPTPDQLARHEMYLQSHQYLAIEAHNAIYEQGIASHEIVMFVIRPCAQLMPLILQMAPRFDGQGIIRGIFSYKLCEMLVPLMPGYKDLLMEKPKAGRVKCVILDENGGTIEDDLMPTSGTVH